MKVIPLHTIVGGLPHDLKSETWLHVPAAETDTLRSIEKNWRATGDDRPTVMHAHRHGSICTTGCSLIFPALNEDPEPETTGESK